jgi:hypothetical protein
MTAYRGVNSYRHGETIDASTPTAFPPSDAILVVAGGISEDLTFKSGAIVASVNLSSVAEGTIIPISLTLIDGAGTYVALYE